MAILLRNLVVLISLFCYDVASAATANISWVPPVARTDGSILGPNDITGYRIEWGTASGSAFGTRINGADTVGTAASAQVTGLNATTYAFRVATLPCSGCPWSNVAIKLFTPADPNPPTLVTVSQIAFELRRNWYGRVYARAIGTVELGTFCGSKQRTVKGRVYTNLSNAEVDLYRRYHGGTVYGECA